MDFIHKILNLLFPIITVLFLIVLSPFYFPLKLLFLIKNRISPENVAGKVVVVTGASSGIGEQLAYEYARRGARLSLVARREDRLQAVAEESRRLGSPDVFLVRADVSDLNDCKRLVDETINHFGQLDHLVNNAGNGDIKMFEDYIRIRDTQTIMNTNFWGSVNVTHFALPHLRKNKGKIVVISAVAGRFALPRFSIICASKAALVKFYETLRIENGSEIGITIVFPGLTQSEITTPDFLSEMGVEMVPRMSTEVCAKTIVAAACRGERDVTLPWWYNCFFCLKTAFPEITDTISRYVQVDRRLSSDKREN